MMRRVTLLTLLTLIVACGDSTNTPAREADVPEPTEAPRDIQDTPRPAGSANATPEAQSKDVFDSITLRTIESNGIQMRIAEAGKANGRTVLLAHGFPESWYSWRHQLQGLAALGFHVVAPDMRGYGGTDQPAEVEAYNIFELAADMVGILDALDVDQAHMVGHDWGAPVASHTVLTYPERFKSLTLMSVPYGPRSQESPLEQMRAAAGDNFYYIVYHNEPGGVAEREYDANTRDFLSRIYLSPNSPRETPEITDPRRAAGGWVPRLGAPLGLPDWLSQADLEYYVSEFNAAGFRGGVNYYRNFERNWEMTADLETYQISAPTLFIAGAEDMVIGGASAEDLRARMLPLIPDLRDVVLFPGIGHWVQQEAAPQTNGRLAQFLINVETEASR